MNRAVLPIMRQQGGGRIVNMSSVAAPIAIPFQAYYSASKAAVRTYSLALASEVRPFGIEVCVIMPGDIATGFTAARRKSCDGDDAYHGHLDAGMTRQGLEGLGTENIDLAILENVGNLVCPAEFDTGAVKNAMILSVPEGDDKPLKYPLMFSICDVLLVNKIDVAPYFNFDLDKCVERVKKLNPNIQVFPISALKGEGIEPWADWLREQTKTWNA